MAGEGWAEGRGTGNFSARDGPSSDRTQATSSRAGLAETPGTPGGCDRGCCPRQSKACGTLRVGDTRRPLATEPRGRTAARCAWSSRESPARLWSVYTVLYRTSTTRRRKRAIEGGGSRSLHTVRMGTGSQSSHSAPARHRLRCTAMQRTRAQAPELLPSPAANT